MSTEDDSVVERTLPSVRRQIAAHLNSLSAAGVEWLPRGPMLAMTMPAAVAVPCPAPTVPVPPVQKLTLPQVEPPLDVVLIDVGNVERGESLEQRRQSLVILAQEVKKCTKCAELASTRTQTVFGQGPPGADLCFIGEAPGGDEDAQGLPFVGAAGQLLNKIIQACGLKREEIYIGNILKCRPPGNRTPLPNESANCRNFLERQLELVKPKYIVAFGGSAATNLLNTTQSLGKLRGRFHDFKGIPVMVTYHPAYLLPHRSPEKKKEVWEDMKWLMAQMGRQIPPRETRT